MKKRVGWIVLWAGVILLGFAGQGRAAMEIRAASVDPLEGYKRMSMLRTKDRIYVGPTVELTEEHVKSAEVIMVGPPPETALEINGIRVVPRTSNNRKVDTTVRPAVAVTLTRSGRKRLAALTRRCRNERVAILVNGKLVMAPPVYDEIEDGKMLITADFTEAEAARLAADLRPR